MPDMIDKVEDAIEILKSKKSEIIKFINKKVNLPLLNEKQEAKLFGQIFDRFMLAIDKFVDKKK